MSAGHVDSFSGPAASLPKGKREASDVVRALLANPRVSTWDMSETPWLRDRVDQLKRGGLITEDKAETYPWHRYVVTDAGRRALMKDHS